MSAGETDDAALILVADDDQDILNLVCLRLEQAGHRTLRAADGEEALMAARTHLPGLCVLDVRMPKLDGFEVLRALRGATETEGIPVIMLTASVHEHDEVRGLDVGADDYVRKPFDARELQARVVEVLRRA
jgi:two-component system alkaline phosphatase synthesis response regulator PhoP